MNNGRIMLIDGNSILNRAFYGLQGRNLLATSDGLFTNAVFGFLNIMQKYLDEEQPGYLCVAFDLRAPTFRHMEFEGYKAKRKGMPPELAVQVPVIKEVLDAMNVRRLESEGFEADDIIGTISLCAENLGMETVIITGDRDSLQLATERTRIKIPATKGGRTETEEYDRNGVIARYGVTPEEFIDVKGLMGDQSDNIPGVPGIGEKTALELIARFKNMDTVYSRLEEMEKQPVAQKLREGRDLAYMSRRLATINREVPDLCGSIEELKRKDFDTVRLYDIFKRLEFKSFIDKFGLKPGKPASAEAKAGPDKAGPDIEIVDSIEGFRAVRASIEKTSRCSIYHLLDREGDFGYRLAGAGIVPGDGRAYYADLANPFAADAFLEEMKEVFCSPAVRICGHDTKSLSVWLKNKGIPFGGAAFDTMIAAYILDPSRESYTVSAIAKERLGIDMEPIEQLSGKGRNRVQFAAMQLDIVSAAAGAHAGIISKAWEVMDAVIRDNGQEELYYNIELPLVEVLADMEHLGFKVDIPALREFSAELSARMEVLEREIKEIAGGEFNINSTKQLGVILFEKLKLPARKKTKTGWSTDAEVLEELAPMHVIAARILEYRQLAKLKSTYAEGLLAVVNPATGRIHSSFNQTVAVTGRISSTEPNLQNIPVKLELGRMIRRVFVPGSGGYVLSDADYSQIELRVLAHISGDQAMSEAFAENEDIHLNTAARIFGVPRESVTQAMRSRAKTVNFGIVYGIGDFSLSRDLGITKKEARGYIDEYFEQYPGVKRYMQETINNGLSHGYVSTIFNRRRYLPELKSSNFNIKAFGERVAMNTPIQGSAADIIKIAMVKVYRELRKRHMKSRLILQVHDELIVETALDEKDEVAAILKECMEGAVRLDVPLLAEVKCGSSWYEAK